MRPISLTMSAFGPYADRQIIDFRELGAKSLFLITGPTGSGKSTVLDAICFALYGETSGQERTGSQMRSQHGDPETPTEVMFDFALGAEQYRVWRRPQQERPKKRGEGTTALLPGASLWKRTGLADDKNDGEPLATKASDVNQKIEQILGFRSDQFRQVVMLPQDKFRKLLLADSREREEILEALFQTEVYRRIEEALKAATKDITDQLYELKVHRDAVLQAAEAETPEELAERLKTAKGERVTVSEHLKIARTRAAEAEKARQLGIEVQAKLQEQSAAEKSLAGLDARKGDVKARQDKLDRAKKAAALQDVEAQRRLRISEAKDAQRAMDETEKDLAKADKARQKAEQLLAKERERLPESEALQAKAHDLEQLLPRVTRLAKVREELQGARQETERLVQQNEEAERAIARLAAELEKAKTALGDAEKLAATAETRQLEANEVRKNLNDWRELKGLREKTRQLEKDQETAEKDAKRTQKDLDEAVGKLRAMERAFSEGSAGILARGLKPGEPCPVCGSKEHPVPAKAHAELPDSAQLELQRGALPDLEGRRDAARNNMVRLDQQIAVALSSAETRQKSLGDKVEAKLVDLDSLLKNSEEQLRVAVSAASQLKAFKAKVTGIEAQHEGSVAEHKKLSETIRSAQAVQDRLSGQTQEQETDIPAELRSPEAITSALEQDREKLRKMALAIEDAQAAAAKAMETLSGCRSAATAANQSFRKATSARDVAENEFLARLKEAGFRTENDYEAARLVDEQVSLLVEEIDQYKKDCAAAQDRNQRASDAAKGLKKPDLGKLQKDVERASESVEESVEALKELEIRIDQIGDSLKSLKAMAKEESSLDAQYSILGRIAEVANGGNSQNITFQRFVLGALLDDVLMAASHRLKTMSKGRYQLQRQRDPIDRRRAAGLDLEVNDAYTGQTRPVCTLSGGESFLAALALALGLADVVQSYAGGIRLDTIFIDEGFGSLDSEALDDAMRSLIDLQQSGRLVGVISHVAEMKERIDTRLEIAAGKSGSTARFVCT